MSIISKITLQKNKSRYNIYIDEQYVLSVTEDVLVKFQLRKGLEITKEFLADIIAEEQIRKGYQLSINYLSYRMRSVKEVTDYLITKEFEANVIVTIINRLKTENYLNDKEFAQAFVQTRLNGSLKGPELIKRELLEKGINDEIICESLQIYNYEKQIEKALELISKKYPIKSKISQAEQDRKIYTLLITKGFSNDVVKQAFQTFRNEEEISIQSEWEAITYQGEKAFKKYQSVSGWGQRQKVKQYLYRKGFAIEIIEKFIESYQEERE